MINEYNSTEATNLVIYFMAKHKTSVLYICIIIIVIVLATYGFMQNNVNYDPKNVASISPTFASTPCNRDVTPCPNQSYAGRIADGCKLTSCPSPRESPLTYITISPPRNLSNSVDTSPLFSCKRDLKQDIVLNEDESAAFQAITADWKSYINTQYHYSFKYPSGSTQSYFNVISDAPDNYSDGIMVDSAGKNLSVFGLSISTLDKHHDEFNNYYNEQKHLSDTNGKYFDGDYQIEQVEFFPGQQAILTDDGKSWGNNKPADYSLEMIRNNVLYSLSVNKALAPLSCLILYTFEFTDQLETEKTTAIISP